MLTRPAPLFSGASKLKPGDLLEMSGVPVRFTLNPRARRVSLRLDPARREILAIAPSARRLTEAHAFALLRRDWMQRALATAPEPIRILPGLVVSLEGRPCRLERAAMRIAPVLHPAVGDEPMRLVASGAAPAYGRAVVRRLKGLALERAEALSLTYLDRLKLPGRPEISVMDAKMRWGSCRAAHGGRPASLRYSWRLILAPPTIFDYVAAHETAHLLVANHSQAFWRIVRGLHPDLEASRGWLKANGRDLHALTP